MSESVDDTPESQFVDPYEEIIFGTYTDAEIIEIQKLMQDWDRATYPTLANSIVDHADRHNFAGDYLRYLRKAANFSRKGARRKILPDGAIRWNRGNEFLIERNGKTVSYGEN